MNRILHELKSHAHTLRRAVSKKYLFLFIFLATVYTALAQPSGYTEGNEVCWTFNGRPHQYFRSVGWNSSTDHTLVFFTDTATTCAGMLQQVVASLLEDAGTNWNGVTTLPDASTRKWQIITIQNSNYWLGAYAGDIKYFYEHIGTVDTTAHGRHHIAGITAGVGRAIGYLLNEQGDDNAYRFIFSTGLWLSPQWLSYTNSISNITTQRNMVWFGTADADGGSPPAAAVALYNSLPGSAGVRKWIDSTVGGTHGNSTWNDCMKLTGTTNRWTWMILPPGGTNPPDANAGSNQQVLLPSSSVTLTGSGTDTDGTITSYAWSKISGGGATITNPSSASTTVTGLSRGVYKFRLIVTDNDGLKDTAYTLVSVTSNSHQLQLQTMRMIPTTAWRTAENLVDGNLSTNACETFIGGDLAIPQEFVYILGENGKDSTYDNLKIRIYNGPFAAGVTFTMWLMADNFADSISINDATPYDGWKYIDTNFTRIAPWPVRYIKFKVNSCASNWGELQIYGTSVASASSFFVDQNFTQVSPKFTSFFGANVNGDEPDSLWNAFHSVRFNCTTWYFDTATAGVTPSTHKYIYSKFGDNIPGWTAEKNQFGFNREMWFYTGGPSAANMPVPRPYNPSIPDQWSYYAAYSYWKDIPPASDSTNPANWVNQGRLGYATAALFGRNAGASLTGYTITASNLTPGQNILRGIEFGNESNATWAGVTGYSSPQVKVANLSAAYDGHMGTLGARVGVKKADTSFKVYAGALVSADSSYLKALGYWITRYRGKGNAPFDVLCINAYCTDAGVQHAGTQGVSPEQFRTYEYWTKALDIVHRMIGNVEVRWSEFGWDSNPNTNYSAKAHGSKDAQEVKADRIIHAYHIGRLAHLHGADQYRSRDEQAQASNADFATSGQFGQPGIYTRWKTSYWMSTTLSVLKGYNAWPTLITKGDSTGIWVLRDDPVTSDTTVYTLFRGTNDGSTQSYTLNFGSTPLWGERVDMQNGNKTGSRTTLSFTGSSITLSNIGESPVYIRVRLGGGMLMKSAVQINAYPNPSSGSVNLDVQRNVEVIDQSSTADKQAIEKPYGSLQQVIIKRVDVYNNAGVLFKTFNFSSGKSNNVHVNVSGHPAGVYHFVITTNIGTFTKKVELLKP